MLTKVLAALELSWRLWFLHQWQGQNNNPPNVFWQWTQDSNTNNNMCDGAGVALREKKRKSKSAQRISVVVFYIGHENIHILKWYSWGCSDAPHTFHAAWYKYTVEIQIHQKIPDFTFFLLEGPSYNLF